MKIIIRKIIGTFLIAIGSILIWVLLVVSTTPNGARFAPAWTGFALIGGAIGIIYLWTTGWSEKSKQEDLSDKKDLFKM